MKLLDFFRGKRRQTANIAKERLSVVIAHERNKRDGDEDSPDYLPMLKQDLIDVIRKYVPIDADDVNVRLEKHSDCDILELNINLSEKA